jgi:hypothetical protein
VDFDVFLFHYSGDKPSVEEIARKLKAGIPTRRVSKSRLLVANKFTVTCVRQVEPG